MKLKRTVLFAVILLFVAACGEGKWHTHDPFTRPTPAGSNAAVYFLLHNATSHDDALVGATTDVADIVEIHMSAMVDDLSGMVAGGQEADHEHEEGEGEEHEHEADVEHPMSELEQQDLANVGGMTMQNRVEIAAGHEIEFAPGGYHLMLVNINRGLVAGDHFELTLHFEHSEDLILEVHVIAP